MYYAHTDHLGSLRLLTADDVNKSIVSRYHFDPWGKRTLVFDTNITNRGFTMHEHLDEFGLINMNARLYDPVLGRFLSPDPYIQFPNFSQSFNGYSICLNNPLFYTDPTGEIVWIPLLIGGVVGGIINVATNWNNINSFGQGLSSFGIGATQGALTAINPMLGASIGNAFAGAGNNIIAQINGSGKKIDWGSVGSSAYIGGLTGAATFGANRYLNTNKITNKILDVTGITNTTVRNIAGSTINGVAAGTVSGAVRGSLTGMSGGEWNLWEFTWKGALSGGAGGILYGSLMEAGYQLQLKYGRNSILNNKTTTTTARLGRSVPYKVTKYSGSEAFGDTNGLGNGMMDGGCPGEIYIIWDRAAGTSSVYIKMFNNSNNIWIPPIPPAPYILYE